MTDCVFCKIVSGDLPSSKVYEDERTNGKQILAFSTSVTFVSVDDNGNKRVITGDI